MTRTRWWWWVVGALLPFVIWPLFDWSHEAALWLTSLWFARTGTMPAWSTTALVQLGCAIVLAGVSGLVLFLALRAMRRIGVADGVGWLAAAVSVAIAVASLVTAPPTAAESNAALAAISYALPGIAMAIGAAAALLFRVRKKTRPKKS